MNNIKLISILLILTNCGGTSHFSEELGNGYVFSNRGIDLKEIYSPNDSLRNIYGKVTGYVYNDTIILASQQPKSNIHTNSIGSEIRRKNKLLYLSNSEDDRQKSEILADSFIRNDPYYKSVFANKKNYWVILSKKHLMYGPLTKSEYQKILIQLRVPSYLSLEN